MRNYLITIFILSSMVFPHLAFSGAIDGSVPCLCAITKVIECDSQGDCEEISPEAVNIPTFIKVDFKNKLLSALDDKSSKTSQIRSIAKSDQQMVLQGAEGSRAWSMMMDRDTGKISASVSGKHFGFLLFGACTPMP